MKSIENNQQNPTNKELLSRIKTQKLGSNATDLMIIEEIKNGNVLAFDLIVDKYYGKVGSIVSRYIKSSEVADVVQEVFIRVYSSLDKFRGESAFFTWLYRISANSAKNHLISSSRTPLDKTLNFEAESEEEAKVFMRDESGSLEEKISAEELESDIFKAIQELPKNLQEVLYLREINQLSYEEIAKSTGSNLGTIRSRIFRAREIVKAKLEQII